MKILVLNIKLTIPFPCIFLKHKCIGVQGLYHIPYPQNFKCFKNDFFLNEVKFFLRTRVRGSVGIVIHRIVL